MLVKKLKKKILALISVFFLSFSFSMASLDELGGGGAASDEIINDNASSMNIRSFAYVLTILGMEEVDQMSFGAFTPSTGGTIDTSGATTGEVTSILNVANIANPQPAVINMTGDPDEDFNLLINNGNESISLTHTNGTDTMVVALQGSLDQDRIFDGSGFSSRTIEGTLTVANDQLTGLYSGIYGVAIQYID